MPIFSTLLRTKGSIRLYNVQIYNDIHPKFLLYRVVLWNTYIRASFTRTRETAHSDSQGSRLRRTKVLPLAPSLVGLRRDASASVFLYSYMLAFPSHSTFYTVRIQLRLKKKKTPTEIYRRTRHSTFSIVPTRSAPRPRGNTCTRLSGSVGTQTRGSRESKLPPRHFRPRSRPEADRSVVFPAECRLLSRQYTPLRSCLFQIIGKCNLAALRGL